MGIIVEVREKLLFIGDSLIEFFDWAGRFLSNDVLNYGVAGETAEGLLSRLEWVIQAAKAEGPPDRIFIMTGINNLGMGDSGFVRTDGAYRAILKKISRAFPSGRIYVFSLLPVNFPWIANSEIREVNAELKKIAGEENAVYIDIHEKFIRPSGEAIREFLLEDGVHLSEEGYRVWSEVVEAIIKGSR